MLSMEEIFELEEELKDHLSENLEQILIRLNRENRLGTLLDLLEFDDSAEEDPFWIKDGNVIVIGQANVNVDALRSVVKNVGLDKKRFEFYLDYDVAVRFDFRKTRWSDKYAAILVGPMPHSGASKGDYSSVIAALQQEEGYPPVFRIENGKGLTITKNSFQSALEELLQNGIIE